MLRPTLITLIIRCLSQYIIDMLDKILPANIADAIGRHLNYDKVYEIRMRLNRPVVINYAGKYAHLTDGGLSDEPENAFKLDRKAAEGLIYRASGHSVYAFNDQIKQAFITVSGGIRIGIAGEIVWENGKVVTIKNFTSVNIRIPHAVKNCSLNAFRHIADGTVNNTLVISPPGAGKTTFLRDLCVQFSRLVPIQNVLLLDERSEIAAVSEGTPMLDAGLYTDIMSGCTKEFGFSQGIRSLRPDIIVTDELGTSADIAAAAQAMLHGVKIIASAHAYGHKDLTVNPDFNEIIKKRLFKRYLILSSRRGPGTYEGMFDENFNALTLY